MSIYITVMDLYIQLYFSPNKSIKVWHFIGTWPPAPFLCFPYKSQDPPPPLGSYSPECKILFCTCKFLFMFIVECTHSHSIDLVFFSFKPKMFWSEAYLTSTLFSQTTDPDVRMFWIDVNVVLTDKWSWCQDVLSWSSPNVNVVLTDNWSWCQDVLNWRQRCSHRQLILMSGCSELTSTLFSQTTDPDVRMFWIDVNVVLTDNWSWCQDVLNWNSPNVNVVLTDNWSWCQDVLNWRQRCSHRQLILMSGCSELKLT